MANANLDVLLTVLARSTWAFYIVYIFVVLIRSAMREGILRAGLELLTYRVLLPLLLPIAATLASMAIVFVHPQQTGVIVSILSPGGVRPEALPSGLHAIIPFLEFEHLYPIYWQTYTMSARIGEGDSVRDDSISARTSDGQEVLLDTSVIFRIDQEQAVTIYIDWQDRYIEDFVRPIIRGYVRQQVSQFDVNEVNSSARADLEALLDRLLEEEFADKGIILDQFLLRNIAFTPEFASAIEQKQVALQGVERTRNEAQQTVNLAEGRATAIELEANAEANAIRRRAEGQADGLKLIADALAQDEQLLTYSYIDKLSPQIDVMLLPNDTPFLFPLPEINQQQNITQTTTTSNNAATEETTAAENQPAPVPTPTLPFSEDAP